MPGTTTPLAIKAQSQSPEQTTKPARRRPQPFIAADASSPQQFTDLEIRFALALRKLAPSSKRRWVETFERVAESYLQEVAAARAKPKLRLIAGGAK